MFYNELTCVITLCIIIVLLFIFMPYHGHYALYCYIIHFYHLGMICFSTHETLTLYLLLVHTVFFFVVKNGSSQ